MKPEYYVTATPVPGATLHPYDIEVPGKYVVSLHNPSIPQQDQVDAVLDVFHCKIGIKVLNDFDIQVTDLEGNELYPSGDSENHYDYGDDGDLSRL